MILSLEYGVFRVRRSLLAEAAACPDACSPAGIERARKSGGRGVGLCGIVLLLVICLGGTVARADELPHNFDIPASKASQGLALFAEQTGIPLIYLNENVRNKRTNRVAGRYTATEALEILLSGTGIDGSFNERRVLTVTVEKSGDDVESEFVAEIEKSPEGKGDTVRKRGLLAGIVAALAGASGADVRADEAAELTSEPSQLNEIVVTGTRIRGVKNNAAPTVIVDRSEIEQSGLVTSEELIRTLPQNFASITSSSRFAIDGGPRIAGENPERATGIDLRGLGPESSLTLVSGTRRAGSARGRVVDVSAIPLSVVERLEIVTGGRSAIYGSDAVGGVANIVTRREFDGIETQLSYGSQGDGADRISASQLVGFAGEEKGGILVYDFEEEDALDLAKTDLLISPRPSDLTRTLRLDIVPSSTRHSVFAAGHAQLSEIVTFEADVLASRRDSETLDISVFDGSTVESPNATDILSENVGGSAHFLVDVSNAWQMKFSGSGSSASVGTDIDQTVDFGDFVFSVDSRDRVKSAVYSVGAIAEGPLANLATVTPRLAIGLEQRQEEYERRFASTVTFDGVSGPPTIRDEEGSRGISSLFAELQLPLLGGDSSNGGQRLDVSIAGRYDDYDDFGNTFNPQAGVVWQPLSQISFRATYAEAFRAPALVELEPFGAANFDSVADPTTGGTSPVLELGGNNPNLGPERADTWSVGIDFEPNFAEGFRVSVSYFDIRYKGRIDIPAFSFTDQLLILEREAQYPGLLNRSPSAEEVAEALAFDSDGFFNNSTGTPFNPATQDPLDVFPNLILFDNRTNNIAIERFDGIDIQLEGEIPLDRGVFLFGVNTTYTLNHTRRVTATSPDAELRNEVGKPADLRGRAHVGFTLGAWGAFVYGNYTDGYSNPFSDPPSNISSYSTVDLNLAFDGPDDQSTSSFLSGWRASLAVANLFDVEPPRFAESTFGLGYDPVNASPVGRFITLQLRKKW